MRLLLSSSLIALLLLAPAHAREPVPCAERDPLRKPWFGDLHVHTRHSLDASTQGTRTTPTQAYEFARGARIGVQPWDEDGKPVRSLQLRRPLDFAMVSDHSELIGEVNMCTNPEVEGYNSWQCLLYRYIPIGAYYLFNYMSSMQHSHLGMCGPEGELCLQAALAPWQEMRDAAGEHTDSSAECGFTAFVGYEWTGVQSDSGGNLHRNVVFRNDDVPRLPVSYIDAPGAQLLWDALSNECLDAGGECDALVIPHNSNLSAGYMFPGELDGGGLLTPEYAAMRNRFEPLVEVMQHKGASECYYGPGASDELCAFEQLPLDNIAGYDAPPKPDTGFVRQVLGEGLKLRLQLGSNPYQFGFIASTDTHLGAPGAAEEELFLGHGGAGTSARSEVPPGLPDKLEYNPGGLAVVWAEENRRDALFEGMQRKEAYGTSGPRIISRFFGGWDYPEDLCASPQRIAAAYKGGVPMGAELTAGEGKPRFLLAASRDNGLPGAPGMPLQRIQLIKGWVGPEGTLHEKVVDVAGDPDNGASVDLRTCEPSGAGFDQLCTVWTDDAFDPELPAFYYSRVVENPSCRWSQRQCIAAGIDCANPKTIKEGYSGCCSAEHRPVIQERAWTSPIWYFPPSP